MSESERKRDFFLVQYKRTLTRTIGTFELLNVMSKRDVTLGFVLHRYRHGRREREAVEIHNSLGVVHPGPSGGLRGSLLQVLVGVVAAAAPQPPGPPLRAAPQWTAACSLVPWAVPAWKKLWRKAGEARRSQEWVVWYHADLYTARR